MLKLIQSDEFLLWVGVAPLQTPVIGSRSALAMSVHPTYFDLATPVMVSKRNSSVAQC